MTTNNQNMNTKVKSLDVGSLAEYRKLVEMVRSINNSCDTALYQATSHQHDLMKYNVVLPSGPRLAYEGLQEDQQKVINAQIMGEGVVVLKVTLLAAGFVVGTKGRSIHSISERTGCVIKSWTLYYNTSSSNSSKALRAFKISGSTQSLLQAMQIITAAVDRYKELTEGEFTGQSVNRDQVIDGIMFEYRPPPKRFIPKSARTIQQHHPPVSSPSSTWEVQQKVYSTQGTLTSAQQYNSQDSFPSMSQQYSSGVCDDLPSFEYYYPSSPDYSPRDVAQVVQKVPYPNTHAIKTYNVPLYTSPSIPQYPVYPPPYAPTPPYAPPPPPPPASAPTPSFNPVGQYMVQPNFYVQHCPVRFSRQPAAYSWW